MNAPHSDRYAALRAAQSNGAIILANEGRHGRPDNYHTVGDATRTPKYTCEPHEYVAVVPYSDVAELIEAADGVDATHGPMLNGPADPKVQQLALDRLRAALARFGVTP